MTRNPMNYHAVSRISLSPDVVDCIVFWSKNPEPITGYLDEIAENCPFYFQFTLNAYERDMESNLPSLDKRLSTFRYLSEKYGKDRIIWRYDPVILTDKYTVEWHAKSFKSIVDQLAGYTACCVFSYVDIYDKINNNMKSVNMIPFTNSSIEEIAGNFAEIAHNKSLVLKTCAEEVNLEKYGIKHSCCIDPDLISKLVDCDILIKKDNNQREACGCAESIDIGQYNTCKHGCKYCYANYSQLSVQKRYAAHSVNSSILIGDIEQDDKVTKRKVKSLKQTQITLF